LNGVEYNVDRSVDTKGSGGADACEPARIDEATERTTLHWNHKLFRDHREIGRTEQAVSVYPGLPVVIDWHQRVVLTPGDESPLRITRMLLSGVRLSTKQQQYHDTYKQLWRYEYPEVQVSTGDEAGVVPKHGREMAVTGRYRMENGIFEVSCEYEGDVKRVVVLRREDWTGVYFCPLAQEGEVLLDETVFELKRKLTFPYRPLRGVDLHAKGMDRQADDAADRHGDVVDACSPEDRNKELGE
jgi:hypothetical protein